MNCLYSYELLFSLFVFFDTAGKSEIAHADITFFGCEQVGRFDITVENVGRVKELQAFEDLVNDVLDVLVGEFLVRLNDLVEINFHVICHKIDRAEILVFFFVVVEDITKL